MSTEVLYVDADAGRDGGPARGPLGGERRAVEAAIEAIDREAELFPE